mgnify:CR=1 FL=1
MIDRGRIAANGSTISTSVLIYMALHVECGIDYPALTAYEKQFGPVDIYHGNRGER